MRAVRDVQQYMRANLTCEAAAALNSPSRALSGGERPLRAGGLPRPPRINRGTHAECDAVRAERSVGEAAAAIARVEGDHVDLRSITLAWSETRRLGRRGEVSRLRFSARSRVFTVILAEIVIDCSTWTNISVERSPSISCGHGVFR